MNSVDVRLVLIYGPKAAPLLQSKLLPHSSPLEGAQRGHDERARHGQGHRVACHVVEVMLGNVIQDQAGRIDALQP